MISGDFCMATTAWNGSATPVSRTTTLPMTSEMLLATTFAVAGSLCLASVVSIFCCNSGENAVIAAPTMGLKNDAMVPPTLAIVLQSKPLLGSSTGSSTRGGVPLVSRSSIGAAGWVSGSALPPYCAKILCASARAMVGCPSVP
jgi:hypothetical protein